METHESRSSSPEMNGMSRKRVGAHQGGRVGTKKQRGRPRVEPRDETAADRRRTQIRLAQRTYRARKESTIAFLEDKVARLESALLRTDRSLDEINELVIGTVGLPALAQKLEKATQDIRKCLEHLGHDSQGLGSSPSPNMYHAKPLAQGLAEIYERLSPPLTERNSSDDAQAPLPNNALFEISPKISSMQCSRVDVACSDNITWESSQSGHLGPWHDQIIASGTMSNHVHTQPLQKYDGAYHNQLQNQLHSQPSGGCGDLMVPMANTIVELPLPISVSFQETSFSRFFHRRALEYAYHLLHRPDTRPETIHKTFAYSMRYSSLENIAKRLMSRLMKSANEGLESPVHYPAGSDANNTEMCLVMSPNGSASYCRVGPWLFPEDVENYISRRGIQIDPRAQTVVCNSDVLDNLTDTDASAWGELTTKGMLAHRAAIRTGRTNRQAHPMIDGNWTTEYDNVGDFSRIVGGVSESPSKWMAKHVNDVPFWERKKAVLDVSRFVTCLIESTVCRGKTPGILRKDVDIALGASILSIESF